MSIIKHDSTDAILAWRHPDDTFTGSTELIVRNSQEAIMFQNGQIFNSYTPGIHQLSAHKKLPWWRRFFKKKQEEEKYSYSEIYFINKMGNLNIRWKTESPVVVRDPELELLMNVTADGQFAVKVEDARLFMLKLVGSTKEYTKTDFMNFFRGRLMSIIKDKMVQAIQKDAISFLDMAKHTESIAKNIEEALKPHIEEYGLTISKFYIESMGVEKEDYQKLQEMKQESIMNKSKVEDLRYKEEQLGEATATIRKSQGYTYQEERRFDILEGLTKRTTQPNDHFSENASKQLSEVYATALGSEVTKHTQKVFTEAENKPSKTKKYTCSNCGMNNVEHAKYCIECGEKL